MDCSVSPFLQKSRSQVQGKIIKSKGEEMVKLNTTSGQAGMHRKARSDRDAEVAQIQLNSQQRLPEVTRGS